MCVHRGALRKRPACFTEVSPGVRMLPASAAVFQPFCVFQLFILSSYHFCHQERYCKHCFRYIHSRFEFGAQVTFLSGLHFPQVKNGVSTAQFVSLPGVDTAWREEKGGCSVNPQAWWTRGGQRSEPKPASLHWEQCPGFPLPETTLWRPSGEGILPVYPTQKDRVCPTMQCWDPETQHTDRSQRGQLRWGLHRMAFSPPPCHPHSPSVCCDLRRMGASPMNSQQGRGLWASPWNHVSCGILKRFISTCHIIFCLNQETLLNWDQTNVECPCQNAVLCLFSK